MGTSDQSGLRIGLDVGGSKIEGILMGPGATELARYRVATPRNDYPATIAAIVDLIARLMQNSAADAKIGIAIPGSISPVTGLMQNANSTWLNGRPFDRDLEVALVTPVRLANDANCLALSEAIDSAAENARMVFGVILGTGCGGGLVVNGRLLDGPRGISGEWGHNPLPWATSDEYPGPQCWCGRKGCLETWRAQYGDNSHGLLQIGNGCDRAAGWSSLYWTRAGSRVSFGQKFSVPISRRQDKFQYNPPRDRDWPTLTARPTATTSAASG
jgi:predicted NBD/HSP70 family sugar kinase